MKNPVMSIHMPSTYVNITVGKLFKLATVLIV